MSHEAEEPAQQELLQQDRQQQQHPQHQQQKIAPAAAGPPSQRQRPLPTPRAFLTDLLTSLPGRAAGVAARDDGTSGVTAREADSTPTRAPAAASSAAASGASRPLRVLQGKDRNVFLTLHVLFPNELLPALDLLDRGLVARFLVAGKRTPPRGTGVEEGEGKGEEEEEAAVVPGIAAVAEAASNHQDEGRGGVAETGATSSGVEASNTVGVSDAGGGGRKAATPIESTHATTTTTTTTTTKAAGNTDQPPLPPYPAAGDPAFRPASAPTSLDAAAGAAATSTKPPTAVRSAEHRRAEAVVQTLYYVRSAQQQQQHQFQQYGRSRSRYGHSHHGVQQQHYHHDDDYGGAEAPSLNCYEVRLAAWNCSCPAFAFAAFPAGVREPSPDPVAGHDGDGGSSHDDASAGDASKAVEDVLREFSFGGLRRGGGSGQVPPVCKHLLACLLVERAPGLFGECVEEREVSGEEAAAWAAGWGG